MDYSQSIAFLERLPQPKSWRLERMRKLVKKAGINFEGLKFIHITGSNGKGSTAAMLYSILRQDGKSVALYSSPHLTDWRERFLLNGKIIPEKKFADLAGRVKKAALETKASQFEVLTAMALAWFEVEKPDWVVWEAGLGGRLDATNVVDARYAVLTPISLEHTEKLGKTISKIAWEKSKIIKRNSTAITPNDGIALREIEKECKRQNAKLVKVSKPPKVSCRNDGTEFEFQGRKWKTKLLGFHQAVNASTAITVAKEMGIGEKIIERGLLKAHWPGRMQVFSKKPLVVLDGAHNPAGVEALCHSFSRIFGLKPVLVVGIMKDKEWEKMAGIFSSALKPSLVIATQPKNERSLNARVLAKEFEKRGYKTFVEKNVRKAVETAMLKAVEGKKTVLVAGSLYLIGEVLA